VEDRLALLRSPTYSFFFKGRKMFLALGCLGYEFRGCYFTVKGGFAVESRRALGPVEFDAYLMHLILEDEEK